MAPRTPTSTLPNDSTSADTLTKSSSSSTSDDGSRERSFLSLPLTASKDGVSRFAHSQGFEVLTPVQASTIPLLLKQDVAVQAVTGSGKTLSFLIPVLEHLLSLLSKEKHQQQQQKRKRTQIHSIILSPTRELAQQTYAVALKLFLACGATTPSITTTRQPQLQQQSNTLTPDFAPPLLLTGSGGASSSSASTTASSSHAPSSSSRLVLSDLRVFQQQGNDVLIGTPGRVHDFLSYRSVVDCAEVDYLILDEADVLFGNAALASTLSSILSRLPKQKRIGLFSATTQTASLQEWMNKIGMRNPVWVDVSVVSASDFTEKQTPAAPSIVTANNGSHPQPPPKISSEPAFASSSSSSTVALAARQLYQRTPTTLQNYYLTTRLDEKLSRLVAFLQDHVSDKIIVFFLTCACVEFFGAALQPLLAHQTTLQDNVGNNNLQSNQNHHYPRHVSHVELLHGKLVQKRREKTLERFHAQREKDTSEASVGIVLCCTDVAARGLDVVDVDWVVQMDAPQDPAVFVHRVGRTARAGRRGQSLLFLTEKEEAYIELLHNRQVPITPLPLSERCCCPPNDIMNKSDAFVYPPLLLSTSSDVPLVNVLPLLKQMVLKDRDMLEKGTRAFTSYIRAYKEHRCAFIFRFQSLDLGMLATSFALLRLPKMPELRDRLVVASQSSPQRKQHQQRSNTNQSKHFSSSTKLDNVTVRSRLPHFEPADRDVDIFAIPFLDPIREAARQKRLQLAAVENQGKQKKNTKQMKKKELCGERNDKKKSLYQKVTNYIKNDESSRQKSDLYPKKRGRHARIVDEWDDLAKEERLFRKLRKKQISQLQYDVALAEALDE